MFFHWPFHKFIWIQRKHGGWTIFPFYIIEKTHDHTLYYKYWYRQWSYTMFVHSTAIDIDHDHIIMALVRAVVYFNF